MVFCRASWNWLMTLIAIKIWRRERIKLVWRGDFDSKGIVGYVDDCFVFMAAYTFARGSFMRPERRYIRRQMYMLSSLFALLGLCWIIMLALMK